MTTDIQAAYQKALEEYHSKEQKPKKKRGRPRKEKDDDAKRDAG